MKETALAPSNLAHRVTGIHDNQHGRHKMRLF